MRVADLHCDTATKLFAEKWPLSENDCHISLQKTAGFSQYLQLMAVFTSPSLSDEEGYRRVFFHAA